MEKKKLIIIIISVVLACALALGVFLKVTEDERYIKGKIKGIQQQVDEFRAGERDDINLHDYKKAIKDPQTDEFLISLVKEMCENDETDMLQDFVRGFESADFRSEKILDIINEYFSSAEFDDMTDYEQMKDIVERINSDSYYYKFEMPSVNRDTEFIADYINKNSTKAFTTTKGEGFYADKEDEFSKNVVGLPDSPLYDAVSITYAGDFKYVNKYGVELNRFYEETSYSKYTYYFRDNEIGFKHNFGDVVWSGDYLFCFSDTGELLCYDTIK